MPYYIEILAIKEDLYKPLKAAAEKLNQVQSEFIFDLPPNRLRDALYLQKRDNYLSTDVWDWVKTFRINAGGERKQTIVVVDGYLESPQLGNLFGTTNKQLKIAVFTVEQFEKYVHDLVRYCRYFFVKYAIRFLAPDITSHDDENRKSCIFHKNMARADIKFSLDSGEICGVCSDIVRPHLNPEINDALKAMLLVVSNKYPYALVIKGGGVKGLAFVGAMLELEPHFMFDTFAGTSAGAIAAILFGAGYKPTELRRILEEKDFKDFTDASALGAVWNLITRQGLYPGDAFQTWMRDLLKKKFHYNSEIKLSELKLRTIVYAAQMDEGRLTFDSKDSNLEDAAFAARCSMSIPLFFIPVTINGKRVYDGGLRANFALKQFIDDHPRKPVIGLYLVSGASKKGSVMSEVIDIAISGEEKRIVQNNLNKVVVIDPRPIGTVDFKLSYIKKELLLLSGQVAALIYMKEYHLDIPVDNDKIILLKRRIADIRKELKYKTN